MRNVKFRGKATTENGIEILPKWVVGSLIIADNGDSFITQWRRQEGTGYMSTTYQVIPESIGQYTELPDKKGTEVFGGDIVQIDNTEDVSMWVRGEKALIEYVPGRFRIKTESGEKNMMQEDMSSSIEVIGNIFDNPELIEFGRQLQGKQRGDL